jgi:peptidoglycan L-alanyl-D-glutamate endopeptidase CwlK
MPAFGKKSLKLLEGIHPDLVRVLVEAIKAFDFTITAGQRTLAEQQALYAKGRTAAGSIVTYCDGLDKRSNHQNSPSKAVDLAPWPIDWQDEARFVELGHHVLFVASSLEIGLTWGGNWPGKKRDLPHFELCE